MRRVLISVVVLVVGVGTGARASAQEDDWSDEEGYTKETWPLRFVLRPLTPASRMAELETTVFVDATVGHFAEPVAIIPAFFYGIHDRFALGVTHLRGLCVTGEDSGCPRVYNDVGVEVRYSAFRRARIEIVLGGGPFVQQFGDPPFVDLVARVTARGRLGAAALSVEPFARLAVTGDGNVHVVGVSFRPQVQIGERLAAHGYTALFGVADDLDATVQIPIGLGVRIALGRVDVGAQFTFPNLFGRNQFSEIGLARSDRREILVSMTSRF